MALNEPIYKRTVIEEINKYLLSDDIIVLHGARQVGKTSILYYLTNHLKNNGNITYFIDLEDSRFVKILDSGTDGFKRLLREEGILPAARKKA
ncbi:MAG: AAA family ATPase, partial [Nitrospirota bacterium]